MSYNLIQCCTILGKLTLISQSSDGVEKLLSVGGLSLAVITAKVMQINSCLFHSKGMAEYVLVSDLDEFFIPQGPNFNFNDVINSIARKSNEVNERRLDNDLNKGVEKIAHPHCYVRVQGEAVFNPTLGRYRDINRIWMGQR